MINEDIKNLTLEQKVDRSISLLKKIVNKKTKEVLFDDALWRCNVLRGLGASAFVMFNCENHKTERVRHLVKWTTRKCLYWKVPFIEYSKLRHS
ncbi:MAG TPA: hypothetical protein VMY59_09865 [Candidatus Thermoplasmatota archaeon]|nr:hypothetical protein [Candidatus Thermoplasmatota archaeon]